MDALPIWVLFLLTATAVVGFMELGYRLGRIVHRRSENEKELPVSVVMSGALGLLAFMLSFTFAIVSGRYDARKQLVRDEADAIRTAYARSEFLPEPYRADAAGLLDGYVRLRVEAVQSGDFGQITAVRTEADRIQRQLWRMAVVNARRDMNSDVAALYVEALNEMTSVHAQRVALGLQARIPPAIWIVLSMLLMLGMIGVGYQAAIAGSARTWAISILAISFSLVIALIAELDRPRTAYLRASQQPLADLQAWIATSRNSH